MKIGRTLLLSLALMLSGCQTDINSLIVSNKENSNILSIDELKEFNKEYSGFKTSALTQNYLEKKIRTLLSQNNDLPLVKEIEYARLKHSALLKNIMCTDHSLYTQSTGISKTNINTKINTDPTFANYMSQLSCQANLSNNIVFVSSRDGNNEIYTMNDNGSNILRLTNNTRIDSQPTWSPDRSKIAFSSIINTRWQLNLMNADGTNQTLLTDPNVAGQYTFASWSPDGSKIAFASTKDSNNEIYVMNPDGTNQVRLTNNSAVDTHPAWSPDGSKISFTSYRDNNSQIYMMNSDGTNQVRLSNNSAADTYSAWSPDGSKISFTSDRDGNSEIYVMNADGTNQTRLTNNSVVDNFSSWSPDSSKIIFTSDNEIYVMNADGTNQTRLTNDSYIDLYPKWK